MKYSPAPLTPFPPSRPQNLRVFLSHGASLLTDCSWRNPSVFCSRLFSRTYELPPPPHRFASLAFSSTYELLFSQLSCFHKHLRCPLVFSSTSQFLGRPASGSINGPGARSGEFEQVAVGVSEVEAPASQFPLTFFFHCDSPGLEPGFPVGQFRRGDSEGDVQFAGSVVRRLNC